MSEARPHLVAVPGTSEEVPGAHAPTPSQPERASSLRRLPLWLGVVATICAIGWILSAREGARLSAELDATRGALAQSEARLSAFERRLDQVRGHTNDLVGRIGVVLGEMGALEGDLQALGVLAGEDPQATGNEATEVVPTP